MAMVSLKGSKDNALFGRITHSSHCQQKKQLKAAGGHGRPALLSAAMYQETGCKGT
jgi:hypothetical protein